MGEAGVVGFSMAVSVFEIDKPHGQRPEDGHAKVNEAAKAQMKVEFESDEDLPSDERQDKPEDNARHPRGKVRAENIERWRMSGHLCRAGKVGGVGLARSPTLRARAARLV